MQIYEIETVCAVYKYRNFSEAAHSLCLSPAVVSKHVNKVEQALGVKIFERATKTAPVKVTPEGEKLMFYLNTAAGAIRRAQEVVEEMRGEREERLRVGYLTFVGSYHEEDILSQYLLENPEITLVKKTGGRLDMIKMIFSNEVDALFLPVMEGMDTADSIYAPLNNPNIRIEALFTQDKMAIGLPESHPFAKCEYLTKEHYPRLREETFLFSYALNEVGEQSVVGERERARLTSLLEFSGPMKTRMIDFSKPEIVLRLVETGAGILPQGCFVPRQIGNVHFVPVKDYSDRITLYLISKKDNHSRGLRLLRKCAAEFALGCEEKR